MAVYLSIVILIFLIEFSKSIEIPVFGNGTLYHGSWIETTINETKWTHEEYRIAKEFRSSCRISSECREHAYLCSREGLCECAQGYRIERNQNICIGSVGKRCMYDIHCSSRAYCKGQMICTCKHEYPVISSDKWSCEEFGSKAAVPVSSTTVTFCLLLILQFFCYQCLILEFPVAFLW